MTFWGKNNMNNELELKLQEEFSFMKQNPLDGEQNLYRRFGCDCGDGWYDILRNCCMRITQRYAEAGVPIDFFPAQIKEKFGTLRFYYGYEDAQCGIAAFDFLGSGKSIRIESGNESDDEQKENLRRDIAGIVREAEERSKHTCEKCGAEGVLRTDLSWIQTLCDTCYADKIKALKEGRNFRADKARQIYEEIQKKKNGKD